jgi:hypothetical protein
MLILRRIFAAKKTQKKGLNMKKDEFRRKRDGGEGTTFPNVRAYGDTTAQPSSLYTPKPTTDTK